MSARSIAANRVMDPQRRTNPPLPWRYDDGGRSDAGFRGSAGDCVTRAIAIATGMPYRDVYRDLARLCEERGGPRSARNGVPRSIYDRYLLAHGWAWTPTMTIGSGCRVHLRRGELPVEHGPVIARLSGHLVAIVQGIIRDTGDPSRDGTRCVYGYWTRTRSET